LAMAYDGTNFQLLSPVAAAGITAQNIFDIVSVKTGACPAAAGKTDVAHGLSRKPIVVWIGLECVAGTGTHGWSAGDELDFGNVTANQGAAGYQDAFSYGVDGTNIVVNRAGTTGTDLVRHKTSVTGVAFSTADWSLKAKIV